ncbi:hypothetical protein EDD16DRAFT_1701057 [Pisolithus croceorrhizus]|nr:hypothetical protein EDD16DRAFT_1701057 [Pisolithus croceorrhizus]
MSHHATVTPIPLQGSTFSLGILAVAGLFGGEHALSATGTIPLYKQRRWLGWYNSPGSYVVAMRYGELAKSSLFNGLFPGRRTEPTALLEVDGRSGPKFRAAHSGTVMEETGHLAALFAEGCREMQGVPVEGRVTRRVGVTIAQLEHIPELEVSSKVDPSCLPLFASIPVLVSVSTCAMCAVAHDWYSFSVILLGMLANGISSLVLGSGIFYFTHPGPAKGSPAGDGVLFADNEIIVLKGEEGAVNTITRGSFGLRFATEPHYHDIGWCSVLLLLQFIAQLVLVPQGAPFGQLMFVVSLGVSWGYNIWLSSLDKEKIQRDFLVNNVLQRPKVHKYSLGTRTSTAVFVLLACGSQKVERLLDDLLPNNTKVWMQWKASIINRLEEGGSLVFQPSDWADSSLSGEERALLEILYKDAQSAYEGFMGPQHSS